MSSADLLEADLTSRESKGNISPDCSAKLCGRSCERYQVKMRIKGTLVHFYYRSVYIDITKYYKVVCTCFRQYLFTCVRHIPSKNLYSHSGCYQASERQSQLCLHCGALLSLYFLPFFISLVILFGCIH